MLVKIKTKLTKLNTIIIIRSYSKIIHKLCFYLYQSVNYIKKKKLLIKITVKQLFKY